MPFTTPTLQQLYNRISEDFSGRLLNGAPLKPRSVLSVLAWVWAGGCYSMYFFFSWLTRQALPGSSEAEFLQGWATVWNVMRKPPAQAAGQVTVSGIVGSIIPQGALLVYNSQPVYRFIQDVELGETSQPAQVEATLPGAAYNLQPGAMLSLLQPVAGVQSNCPVVALQGGADEESDDSLRARLLAIIQKPPHGGNADDYVHWALEVPGVTRAWCRPLYAGPGTVGLTFVCDNETSIIPTPEKVEDVYQHTLANCPVTARPGLLLFAPEYLAINIRLRLTPNTVAVREAVARELADLLAGAAPGQLIYLSHINAAVSNAPGEQDHILIAPVANIEPQAHQLPMLGAISYE